MKDGWQLTLNYTEAENVVRLEIIGDAQAVAVGFAFVPASLLEKLARRFEQTELPPGLAEDAACFERIRAGRVIAPHAGKF